MYIDSKSRGDPQILPEKQYEIQNNINIIYVLGKIMVLWGYLMCLGVQMFEIQMQSPHECRGFH